ncbi:hypothetical protein ACX12E_21255 [Paenibacillus vandeheii]
MTKLPKIYTVGDTTVTRVTEMVISGVPPEIYFPGTWDPSFLEANKESFSEGLIDENSQLIVSIGTWVVKTPQHTILIDTATGNDKNLPLNPDLAKICIYLISSDFKRPMLLQKKSITCY